MSKPIAGTLSALAVDGTQYTIGEGEFEVDVVGRVREPIPGTDEYSENLTHTFITGEVLITRGLKTQDVAKISGATVQLTARSGHVYGLNNARYSGPPTIKAKDGVMPVSFTAGPDNGFETPAT
jgi:hypothetical protein